MRQRLLKDLTGTLVDLIATPNRSFCKTFHFCGNRRYFTVMREWPDVITGYAYGYGHEGEEIL